MTISAQTIYCLLGQTLKCDGFMGGR